MKHILFVSTSVHKINNYAVTQYNSIRELLTALITESTVDLIIIDSCILKQSTQSIYDILSSIRLLTEKRTIGVAISADINIKPSLLKELLGLNIIGIYPMGMGFTEMESSLTIEKMLDGKKYIHQRFKTLLLYTKRKTIQDELPHLTSREQQIVNIIKLSGDCNKSIARKLQISENTVKIHINHIFKKLGLKSRTELAITAQ